MDRNAGDELLLRCIGVGVRRDEAARLDRLAGSQWDSMVRKSILLGLGPLLAKRVKAAESHVRIPPAVRSQLRETYVSSAAANLRLYDELSRALVGLRDDGVAVIVLKGAFLAEAVYGDIALRYMSDVDLLVRKEDLARAEASLLRVGFRSFQRWGRHVKGTFRGRGATVMEVHADVARSRAPFQISVSDLWNRTRPARIAGVEVLALCPEDQILHLCVHASHAHRFEMGLRPLCDISETVRCYEGAMYWPQLQHTAEQYGVGTYVYYPLLLAKKLLGADIPAETLSSLKPKASNPEFVETLERYVLDVTPTTLRGLGVTWRLLHTVGKPQALRGKIATLLRWAFPPMDRLRRTYNLSTRSRLAPLYYAVWVFDQVRRRWKDILHWVCRTNTAKHLLSKEKAKETISRTLEFEQQQSR
ncbi:MAG: nucleotidyltransferase domain-containing protein [Planctomycetota bacterium]|jgi:hypothetical protein